MEKATGLDALEAMHRLSGGERSKVIAFLISIAKQYPKVKGDPEGWAEKAQAVARGWAFGWDASKRTERQQEIGEFFLGACAFYPDHILEVCRGLDQWRSGSPHIFQHDPDSMGKK